MVVPSLGYSAPWQASLRQRSPKLLLDAFLQNTFDHISNTMPSIQGIAVDILQPDRDNEVAEARYDKDSRTLKAFRGEIESGFICVPAGERIAVLINFTQPGFTPYSARGMRVIISIARATKEDTQEHGQTWWIPKKCFGTSNEDKGHDFSEVTEFNEDGSVVEVKPRKAPTPAELPDSKWSRTCLILSQSTKTTYSGWDR